MAGRRHRVVVLALDGVHPFEMSIACEVFGLERPELGVDWYDFRVVVEDPSQPVPTTGGFRLMADSGLDGLEDADTVIVPMCPKKPGTERVFDGPLVEEVGPAPLDALRRAHDRGARIVSFCSGAFVLGQAGLLDGRPATTHWMYTDEFRRRFPKVHLQPDVLFVDDGDVLTAAGSSAGIDLSLHLVRNDYGERIADAVARRMVVPPRRDGGQAQYVPFEPPTPTGETFGATLEWMIDHLDEPLTVEDVARRAGMSGRTFARRFREATGTTPHQWLTAQRVARAQHLLETTDWTVDAVASRSGFGTAANLRTQFQRARGVSPTAYRQRFACPA